MGGSDDPVGPVAVPGDPGPGDPGPGDPGPGDPGPEPLRSGLRASDADRERTAAILSQHCGCGRLDPEECATRLEAAFAARTLPELYALTADLPFPDAVVPSATAAGGRAGGAGSALARLVRLLSRR